MPDRCAGAGATALTTGPRAFLFLQGPQSYFFERLGRLLIERGHRIHRINLNLGDRFSWRLPAADFRGRFAEWRDFAAGFIEQHAITDLLLHGDRRPYHSVAGDVAREHGVAVCVTDLGYVRPGWLTLEPDGMTTGSRFPRDPAAIRALATEFPEPDLSRLLVPPFRVLAAHDVAYNLAAVFGRPLYPHYRRHGLYRPFAEYAGWVRNAPRRLLAGRATETAKAGLAAEPGSYFLYPLQLATDFQLRAHSPFDDAREALRSVLASFRGSGGERMLIVVGHPLDEGLINWRRLVRDAKLDRAIYFDGGIPDALLAGAAGIVTVNSTVGLTALRLGVPVKALGRAIYDVPGLTHPGDLAAFWHDPQPPDGELAAAFVRAIIGATQVKGGYHTRAAQAAALPVFADRLERGLYPLPRRSVLSCAVPADSG